MAPFQNLTENLSFKNGFCKIFNKRVCYEKASDGFLNSIYESHFHDLKLELEWAQAQARARRLGSNFGPVVNKPQARKSWA